jgi:hypothetical protein
MADVVLSISVSSQANLASANRASTLTTLVLRNMGLVAKIRIEFQRTAHLAIGQQTSPVSQRIATAFSNRLLKNYPQRWRSF